MSTEQSSEEVQGSLVLGRELISFVLKTGGDLELIHMLFPRYFALSLEKRRAWNFRAKNLRDHLTGSLIFQVKGLKFRKDNCLPLLVSEKTRIRTQALSSQSRAYLTNPL